jgi:hypothetical protein
VPANVARTGDISRRIRGGEPRTGGSMSKERTEICSRRYENDLV